MDLLILLKTLMAVGGIREAIVTVAKAMIIYTFLFPHKVISALPFCVLSRTCVFLHTSRCIRSLKIPFMQPSSMIVRRPLSQESRGFFTHFPWMNGVKPRHSLEILPQKGLVSIISLMSSD